MIHSGTHHHFGEPDAPQPIQTGLFEYPTPKGCKPRLIGNRCRTCGRTFFPKRSLCSQCFIEGELETVYLSGKGVIYASTIVHIPSPAGIQSPYAYGYVDLSEACMRVFALFSDGDLSAYRPGRCVEMVIEPINMDNPARPLIGYKFKLTD